MAASSGATITGRRAASLVVLTAMLLLTVPFSPAAEADPLPTKADDVDDFAPADDGDELGAREDSGDEDPDGATADDDAAPGGLSEPTQTPFAFTMVGFKLPADATVTFRTSLDGSTWSDWSVAEPVDEEDGPDPGSDEARATPETPASDVFFVDQAAWLQLDVEGADLSEIRAHIIDTDGVSATFGERFTNALSRPLVDLEPTSAEAAPRPSIQTRRAWDPNDDCRPRSGPSYANNVSRVVVHHTAGSNSYSRAQAPGIVRGVCLWHRNGNGWSDIGYNMLVDRYGVIYEGRAGGLDRGVIGAHAAGHNTGSFGISVLGNFDVASIPNVAFNAVADAIAWKAHLHGISASNIIGHRDVGSTACPGRHFYQRMGELRTRVASALRSSGGSSSGSSGGHSGNFSDVSGSHAPAIRRIAQLGLTNGCGGNRYCPDRPVTRAEMATFLMRAGKLPSNARTTPFGDVSNGSSHVPGIAAIRSAGWTAGCNNSGTRYCPDRSVTRAEMAAFLVRSNPSINPHWNGNRFNDVSNSSSLRPFINTLHDYGLTQGCGGWRYCPNRPVTRGEMATFLSRSIDAGMR